MKYYYSYLMLTDTSNQLPISFIHIVTVLPLKLMFLNYCNFSRHYISCSNQTLSNKMPYCRRHELVALTLISIKFVLTTHSFDLLMLQKSACSFLKLILIRKILSVLQLHLNMSCFPMLVLSITTFHVILLANATYLFSVFLTLRRLMSYIYGAPILDVSRSHTTTQHSR